MKKYLTSFLGSGMVVVAETSAYAKTTHVSALNRGTLKLSSISNSLRMLSKIHCYFYGISSRIEIMRVDPICQFSFQ